MGNGILIENKTRGIYVDKKLRRDLDDMERFTEIFSEYFFFDYWQDKEIDAAQGDLTPESMFMCFSNCAPMPCCSSMERFTYFSDPKFAAGYLKYIVLGNMACTVLLSNEEYDEICFEDDGDLRVFVMPDVDDILDMCIKNGSGRECVIEKMNHIIRLCNEIFLEQDILKGTELLKDLAAKFNEYFEYGIQGETGWNYTFDVYDGAAEVKDLIIERIGDEQGEEILKEIFSEDEWGDIEKTVLTKVFDVIM